MLKWEYANQDAYIRNSSLCFHTLAFLYQEYRDTSKQQEIEQRRQQENLYPGSKGETEAEASAGTSQPTLQLQLRNNTHSLSLWQNLEAVQSSGLLSRLSQNEIRMQEVHKDTSHLPVKRVSVLDHFAEKQWFCTQPRLMVQDRKDHRQSTFMLKDCDHNYNHINVKVPLAVTQVCEICSLDLAIPCRHSHTLEPFCGLSPQFCLLMLRLGSIFRVFSMTQQGSELTTFQCQGGHSTARPLRWLVSSVSSWVQKIWNEQQWWIFTTFIVNEKLHKANLNILLAKCPEFSFILPKVF